MPATFNDLLGQIRGGGIHGIAQFYSQTGSGGGDGSGGDGSTGGGGGDGFPEPGTYGTGFPGFFPGGPGGGTGGGGGFPGPGPIQIGVPGPTGGGGTTTTVGAHSASWIDSLLNYFTGSGCGVGDFLLRILFFILGVVAIIGAIYLYKGSNPIFAIPAKLTRTAIHHATTAAVEAGAGAGAE